MNFKPRLFIILFLVGMAGVLSFLLVDLNALLTAFQAEGANEFPTITPTLKLLTLVQPTIILALAVFGGVSLASKVGLSSPVAEAVVSGGRWGAALRAQLVPGLIGGIAGGGAIVLTAMVFKPFLDPEIIERIGKLGSMLPVTTRLLYGGIAEELFIRWGLMTFLLWAGWRLFQKDSERPKPAYFHVSIFISSIIFGIGHLPLAFLISPDAAPPLILFTIFANSIFGLFAGYLYWKKGLESAMIAHMLAHVVMLTGSYFGAYF